MQINEKKLIDYLESHLGENIRTLDLAKECGIYKLGEDFEMNIETDMKIRETAKANLYRLNASHHAEDVLGMPWSIDFYIEDADVERDIRRINSAFQLKMKTVLIVEEYGIYDDLGQILLGFRASIPWQIKKLYDEIQQKIEEMESDGRDID